MVLIRLWWKMLLITLHSVVDIRFLDHLLYTVYGIVVNCFHALNRCVPQLSEGDCFRNILRIRP